MPWVLAATVLLAVGVSLVGTRLARAAAQRFRWLDQPSQRKMHRDPIPLLGGLAIYGAFLVAAVVLNSRTIFAESTAVVIGATLLVITGAYDDHRGMSPRVKLAAQLVAAAILWFGGIKVAMLHQAWLDFGLTALWVVGICNAMNLLDNMDGLSAGITAIASAFFAVLALSQGQIWVSIVAAALFGATLGFLWYNWNPATIFMGDAGSLLIGFLLAVLGIKLRFPDGDPSRTWLVPILVLGVPIFDTTLVTISRLRRGVSITSGGKDHLSHRLVRLGLSVRRAVGAIYLIAIASGLLAVVVAFLPITSVAFLVVAWVVLAALDGLVHLERVDLTNTGQAAKETSRLRALGLRFVAVQRAVRGRLDVR